MENINAWLNADRSVHTLKIIPLSSPIATLVVNPRNRSGPIAAK